jgi:hypothetical protein
MNNVENGRGFDCLTYLNRDVRFAKGKFQTTNIGFGLPKNTKEMDC